jgi:general stress protein CsbA
MWQRFLAIILGIWLMAAPAVLGYTGAARTNDAIIGPLAASFAVIAIWEVTRSVRWVNILFALWLLLAPWVLSYEALVPTINSMTVGIIMAVTAAIRGKITQRYGGGWPALWQTNTRQDQTSSK